MSQTKTNGAASADSTSLLLQALQGLAARLDKLEGGDSHAAPGPAKPAPAKAAKPTTITIPALQLEGTQWQSRTKNGKDVSKYSLLQNGTRSDGSPDYTFRIDLGDGVQLSATIRQTL